MQRRIYWAAPLHSEEDQRRNAEKVKQLRERGHLVYVPQEHGLWEDFPDPQKIRPYLYKLDLEAMQIADCCIAYAGDRAPSEGMLWEMGYMAGNNKPVYLLNDYMWDYNLMIEFGVTHMFNNWDSLLTYLEAEAFLGVAPVKAGVTLEEDIYSELFDDDDEEGV